MGVIPAHLARLVSHLFSSLLYIVSAYWPFSEGLFGAICEFFLTLHILQRGSTRAVTLNLGQYRPPGQLRPVVVASSCSCDQLQLRPAALEHLFGTGVRNGRSERLC